MKGVYMDVGAIPLIFQQLNNPPFSSGNAVMGLLEGIAAVHNNDTTATVLAFESTFGGYARQVLSGPTTGVTTGGVTRSNFNLVTFTNSSGSDKTIDGWFFLNTTTGELLMAGLYDVPVLIPAGDTFPTRPFWTQQGRFTVSP